ncbi:hypothetical protein CBL_21114 [Carabus blaptoides fortunei]
MTSRAIRVTEILMRYTGNTDSPYRFLPVGTAEFRSRRRLPQHSNRDGLSNRNGYGGGIDTHISTHTETEAMLLAADGGGGTTGSPGRLGSEIKIKSSPKCDMSTELTLANNKNRIQTNREHELLSPKENMKVS